MRALKIVWLEFRNDSLGDFAKTLLRALFAYKKVLIFEKDLDEGGFAEIECRLGERIMKGDIGELNAEINAMETPPWELRCHEYDGVKDFFMFRDENGAIGHITWIYYSGDRNPDIELGPEEAEVRSGLTSEKYRGERLGPATLVRTQKFLKENGYRKVFMCVLEENAASINAVKRAGFRLAKKKTFVKAFGIRVSRRYSSAREKWM